VAGFAVYLTLPRVVQEGVQSLVYDIIHSAHAKTPYAKAKAIRDFLLTSYRYDFDFTSAPPAREPTSYSLHAARRGVCVHFSNAFVVLARAANLPARPVVGWVINSLPDR
jgi:transglutaminase-like putative cysteine protease